MVLEHLEVLIMQSGAKNFRRSRISRQTWGDWLYSVLGMSEEQPVQIRCKRTH